MKIAYIVPSLIRSGPIKVVHQLVEALQKEHDVEVYYFKVPQREKLKFDAPVHYIGFREVIDFDAYDIIHSHTILADAYVWYHRKKIHKAKTVTTLHNYAKEDLVFSYGKIKAFWMVKVWELVTLKHDRVVVLSKDAVKYYKKFWRNQNLTYVYNGVAPIHIKETSSVETDAAIKIGVIASAGGISRRKGIDQVIRVLAGLPGHMLFIAGKETGESEVLKDLAHSLGVDDRVKFMGYCSDMDGFISDMDIFVIPSRSEGLPLSLLEIASAKKAIVCSDIPIFKEVMKSGEVKFFALEDIESLKHAIEEVDLKRELYADKAYAAYIANYTTKKMAENYLKVYKTLLKADKDEK